MSTATPADFPPALQPTLGVSSLDLGRSPASGPFFCPQAPYGCSPLHGSTATSLQSPKTSGRGCPVGELGQPG